MSAPKTETDPKDKPIAANSNTGNPGENSRPRKKRTFREKWRAVSINNKLIVIFAGLTTIATVVYSVFAGWQLYEIHSGAKDTHDLAVAADTQAKKMGSMSDAADKIRQAAEGMVAQEQRIADNAQSSLDASNRHSKAALDASIASSRLDQRPWLTASSLKLSEEPSLNNPVTVTVGVGNTGKTPAFGMIPASRLSSWDTEPPPVVFDQTSPHSRSIQAPGVTNVSFTTGPLTLTATAQIDAYNNKINKIYIQALIQYGDAFKRQHWTTVCAFHVAGTPLDSFTYCASGNEVDEEEEKKAN